MAYLIRLLGAGATTGGSSIVAYSVSAASTPPASAAILSNVRLGNTQGSAVTANIFYRPSGGSQIRIAEKDKSIATGSIFTVKPELTMALGDTIEVSTSAAIDYVVCGIERE
jgi:hypothetical protein